MRRQGWEAGVLLCAAAAIAGTSCGGTAGGSPGSSLTARPTVPLTNTSPTASLSGMWVGARPGDGIALDFSACGTCAGTPPLSAGDVVLTISDSDHALSGNATVATADGEVIPTSVTGAVTAGARVTMRWEATLGSGGQSPTAAVFTLEGTVSANRMSGTVILTGPAVPGGSADGTWSVRLR
jgi:hypothetical protein